MVSKARDDLPDPLRPVMIVSESRGMVTSMFLRLCSRAPWTRMKDLCMVMSRASYDRRGAISNGKFGDFAGVETPKAVCNPGRAG